MQRLSRSTSSRDLQSAGVLAILARRFDTAISLLERATRVTPDVPSDRTTIRSEDKAAILADLSAAYLAKASSQGERRNLLDLIAALDAAEKSLSLDPERIEALYNRALALAWLPLPSQAAKAWGEYSASETDPSWFPIRTTINAIPAGKPRKTRIWKGDPQDACSWAAGALGSWGLLRQSGQHSRAVEDLQRLREIWRDIGEFAGDWLLADSIAGIDQALAAHPVRLAELVRALIDYREGFEQFKQRQFSQAEAALGRARSTLRQQENPFAAWADLLWARCAYERQDPTELGKRAQESLQRVDTVRYPVVAARLHWFLGASHAQRGRPAEALASYQRALAQFSKVDDFQQKTALHSLLARTFSELGDVSSAWRHHALALQGFAQRKDSNRLRIELTDLALDTLKAGYPYAAIRLQKASVEIAKKQGDPRLFASALLDLASLLDRSGLGDAGPVLLNARSQYELVVDSTIRRNLLSDLLVAEGFHFRTRDPARALQALTAAAAMQQPIQRPLPLAPILYTRALVWQELGKDAEAVRDLQNALKILEAERGSIPSAEHRGTFFNHIGAVYDTLVLLEAERGHAEDAFNTAERRRTRLLLDWLSAEAGDLDSRRLQLRSWIQPKPFRELQRQLPDGVVLLGYEPLSEQTLLWMVRRDGLSPVKRLPISVTDLEAQIQRLLRSVHRSEERSVQKAGAALYESLLAPVSELLRPEEILIFAPRSPLDTLPFGLLYNPETKRFLIEDRPFAVSPSLNLFAQLRSRAGREDFSQANVLAITDPKVDRLDPLPAARQEGNALRKLYGPRARLVSGQAADREVFLEGLKRYRIVHFGGHAEANSTQPWLSNLSLAPRPDRSDSGVLYSRELVGSMDAVADLVVLSACGSAGGAAQPGEGVAGLVWPLFSRGVPRVIATLWSVKDGEAGAITTTLYRHLRAGEAPSKALRLAQLEALEAQRHAAHPSFDWAAFQLYGAVSSR
jgi:CHAT domain-containing protein/tetratricopeptide (TPR) repeat protein